VDLSSNVIYRLSLTSSSLKNVIKFSPDPVIVMTRDINSWRDLIAKPTTNIVKNCLKTEIEIRAWSALKESYWN
jgi:hypothetical protein